MDSLRDKIAVVGIGETEYSLRPGRPVRTLIVEAIDKALDDAKLTIKDIDGIVIEGSWAPFHLSAFELAYGLGIQPRFCETIGGSGSGNCASFHLDAMAIANGRANTVLTYYSNAYRSTHHRGYERHLTAGVKDSFEVPYGGSVDPNIDFAMVARRYAYEYGLTEEQFNQTLGTIAVDHRRKAILNGKGVLQEPLTLEDYMNNPMVCDPLRLPDYCRWNDGACAWITTSAERAKDFPHVPVYVTGLGYSTAADAMAGDYWINGKETYFHKPHMAVALNRALKMAGISLKDLDFAQVYDAYTIMLLIFLESLGFCKKGEGPAFVESGAMALDGSMPINTHGGHLSHSYINMASHVVEAVKQLSGEAGPGQIKGAKFGMFDGGGSNHEYITILRRG
jgi:acetyl-CoA acetyltransferase